MTMKESAFIDVTRLENSLLRTYFLDYFNNFITLQGFADYYSFSLSDAEYIVSKGRLLHEANVVEFKSKRTNQKTGEQNGHTNHQ